MEYYENYIFAQVQAGRTEEEILKELGDPRLIAKTLLDTGQPYGGNAYTGSDQDRRYEEPQERPSGRRVFAKIDLSTWQGRLLVMVLTAVILILLITLLSALVPVVLVFCAVGAVVSWFKKRR